MSRLVAAARTTRRIAPYLLVGLYLAAAFIGRIHASHDELRSYSDDAASDAVSEVESRVGDLESTKDDHEDRISDLESRERY